MTKKRFTKKIFLPTTIYPRKAIYGGSNERKSYLIVKNFTSDF
jgi:hypothetical protein